MSRLVLIVLASTLALPLAAQEGPEPQPDSKVTVPLKKKAAPPRSDQQEQGTGAADRNGEYSSSKTMIIDLSPPGGDNRRADKEAADHVHEMKPWNPHKAEKSIEVGDFYFKRKNYRAAESRYREALQYKDNDAIATFRLGQVLERTQRGDEALEYYQAYLKILPHGEFAEECHKAIVRLSKTAKTVHE